MLMAMHMPAVSPHVRLAQQDAAHLTKHQVGRLWNAGSLLVQEYGVFFNARVTLTHDQLRAGGVYDGDEFARELVRQLGMRLKYWRPRANFHWLYVRENIEERGLVTTVALHVPDDLHGDVQHWLVNHFLWKRLSSLQRRASLRFSSYDRHRSNTVNMRRHLRLMQMLCRSVNPDLRVSCGGDRRALVDVLAIRGRSKHRFLHVAGHRLQISQSLNHKTSDRVRREGLPTLSAFNDKAFDHLLSGWEVHEHNDRQKAKTELEQEFAKIHVEWPIGVDEQHDLVRDIAIKKVRLNWSDPRQRLRDWEGWWLRYDDPV